MKHPTAVPRHHPHPPVARRAPGFSLVEVCIAIGIIAFAVLPLVGLLSLGLKNYRTTTTRNQATQALNQISYSLLHAAPLVSGTSPTGQYVALPPLPQSAQSGLTPITWSLATTVPANATSYAVYLDDQGTILSVVSPIPATPTFSAAARLVAGVVVTPPTTKYDAGSAQITVVWPPQGGPIYSASNGFQFFNTPGHVENSIILLPVAN